MRNIGKNRELIKKDMNGNRDSKIGNVGILEGKKISRDSKDTRADSFRVKDQA